MEVGNACEPVFARHESFHLRYGWLKKAYEQVKEDKGIFKNERATVRLGVGKNMVRSIKFWGLASKLFEEAGPGKVRPTDLGKALLDDNGYDPYLENMETLWLLHWLLLSKPCKLPVWWLIMNKFSAGNTPVKNVKKDVEAGVRGVGAWTTPSMNSVKRDIDAFIHTYAAKDGTPSIEEYLDCPLRQLRLARHESDHLRFSFGRKDGLTPGIVAYACLDYMDKADIASKSVPVSRLASEHGSVGPTFKMSEDDISASLHDAVGFGVTVNNVGGTQHLIRERDNESMEDMLESIYREAMLA